MELLEVVLHLQFLKYGMQFFNKKEMTKKGYIILFIVFVTVTGIIRYFILEESSLRSLLTQTMVAGIIFTGLIYFVKRKKNVV